MDPLREHHLYQASYLLRDHGFDLEYLPFTIDGNLPLQTDPKLAWASAHLRKKPLELNLAEKNELLRVPGIGIRGAEAILEFRIRSALRDLDFLKKLGIVAERAAPYILLDGHRPQIQLPLFSSPQP